MARFEKFKNWLVANDPLHLGNLSARELFICQIREIKFSRMLSVLQ